jgi:hypothetical protein
MKHPSELIEKVTSLWKAGQHSAAQVGTETGLTRNAVIGIVWRLKVAKPKPQAPAAAKPKAVARPRPTRCSVAGCDLAPTSRGWCWKHYESWLYSGDPEQVDVDARERMDKRELRHLSYAPMNALANEIALPGMDKHLRPLMLYKGTGSFGRVHRWWNFALTAKTVGVEDLADLVHLSHNPAFSHLCETPTPVSRMSAQAFFSRLRLNPEVTNNIPEMTEWVEYVLPRPFQLTPVPLVSAYRNCAAWRIYKPARKVVRANIRQVDVACYPFIAHDPKRSTGADLVLKVNAAVPRGLPEEFRADICQDIILAILTGEMKESELANGVRHFVKVGQKMFGDRWSTLQLDAPIPGLDGVTYLDGLAGDINSEWTVEGIDEAA